MGNIEKISNREEIIVSIIMPLYNGESRLELSIESVINQQYNNFELIIINDGSTDKSNYILKKYFDNQKIKIINQVNSGVSVARNRGIAEASGKFIAFLDADDTLSDGYFINLEKYLTNEIDIIIFGMQFCIYNNLEKIDSKLHTYSRNMVFNSSDIDKYFFELYSINYLTPVWNKLIRRDILLDHEINFSSEMAILEDFNFVLETLMETQRISVVQNSLYNYYVNVGESSFSRRPNIDYKRNFKILDESLVLFARKSSLYSGVNRAKINGIIFRSYLISLEKTMQSTATILEKFRSTKKFVFDIDVQNKALDARVDRKGVDLLIFLVKKKLVTPFFIIIYFASLRK